MKTTHVKLFKIIANPLALLSKPTFPERPGVMLASISNIKVTPFILDLG